MAGGMLQAQEDRKNLIRGPWAVHLKYLFSPTATFS